MDEKRHKKTVEELVHDDSFILCCLFPEETGAMTWIDDYLASFPDEKEHIEQARQRVRSIKLNRWRLTAAEKDSLRSSIAEDRKIRRKAKRIRLAWQSAAAACLLAACMLGSYSAFRHGKAIGYNEDPYLAYQQTDTAQTEVELHLAEEKIEVSDRSTIQIDREGKVIVADKEIKNIKPDKTEKSGNKQEAERMNMLSVPKGRRSSLVLPDGTKIWVNSATELRFPETFAKDKREIYVDGEVYLEVTKDADHPFYVKTKRMEVKVLGTSFGVTAYNDEPAQSVVLKEGSVSVRSSNGSRTIRPNEMLLLDAGRISVGKVNVYDYISWIDGILRFRDKNAGEILHSLARYYRVEFDAPQGIKDQKCSGKLVLFDDIDQMLLTLRPMLSVSYHREGDHIELTSVKNKD